MGVRKIAIIGLSPTTHDLAPWDDLSWEKWGLPWDEGYWLHYNRLFEMHKLDLIRSIPCRKRGYEERLASLDVPLYMQESYQEFSAIRYPFEDVAEVTGNYFNSSIGYMIALAIYEKVDEIGVWGVDMKADDEYGYQKPNTEYLLGLAKGLGIKIHIPNESPLLKFQGTGIKFGNYLPEYKGRYGWL